MAPDAPLGDGWLLRRWKGSLPGVGQGVPKVAGVRVLAPGVTETLRKRYLGGAGALYLIRPDQVVAARWVAAEPQEIAAALAAAWEGRT